VFQLLTPLTKARRHRYISIYLFPSEVEQERYKFQMIEQQTTITHSDSNFQIILVVGNSRSGTTMMGRVLGKHDSVFTFNELHFFEELWDPQEKPQPLKVEQAVLLVSRLLTIQRDGYFYQRDLSSYADEAGRIIKDLPEPYTPPRLLLVFLKYETNRHGKTVACLQTPRDVYYLEEILALYPGAYAVNMIRDPRDILLSQKKRWMNRISGPRKIPVKYILRTWADYHPITISMLWRSGIRVGDRFADSPRVCHIKFEDLLQAPLQTVQKICVFCGIPFQPEMLNVPHTGSSNRPDQPDQTGIDSSVSGRWRDGVLNNTEIYINQKMTAENMQRHGYLIEPVQPNPLKLLYYGVTWVLEMGLVLVLNKNRVRNFIPAIKKRLMK
jgi:hypothetical protein